jgi:hypothetical protein
MENPVQESLLFQIGSNEMAISKILLKKVKLSSLKGYEIAHIAGIHPSTLSKIMCGIERVNPGDHRVISIGRVLGISANDCFQESTSE